MRSSLALAVVLCATFAGRGVAFAGQAQQPHLTNGQVTVQAAPAPFADGMRTLIAAERGPLWIGYTVPSTKHNDSCCCDDMATSRRTRVSLEGSTTMAVLARVADGRVERVRTFAQECELDAGGLAVRWLEQVRPADSLAWLETLVGTSGDRQDRITGGALAAVAMHAEPAAGEALIRLARGHASTKVRGDALFWLAQRAGQQAAAQITRAIEDDPDTEVKKKAVFALSQLPRDEGVPLLIKVARTNPNPAVKKQAMFWLGQSKDPRAIDFFAEILGR